MQFETIMDRYDIEYNKTEPASNKIEKHLIFDCQDLLDDLPYPNEGLANKALKKAGLELKRLFDKFEFHFLLNEDNGDCVRVRFEKFTTPKNRIEFYVTEKEWIRLYKSENGFFYLTNPKELEL